MITREPQGPLPQTSIKCGCGPQQHHPTDCLRGLAQHEAGREELRRQLRHLNRAARRGPAQGRKVAEAEVVFLQQLLAQGVAHA